LFNALRFPSRTPAGVPVSDPFAEVRLLKTWARLGVYSAILFFSPIDIFLVGFTLGQTVFVQVAYIAVATGAIEVIFGQSLRLRKRSAYPARMLVEIGSLSSVSEATDTCLHVLQRLLGIRRGVLLAAWGSETQELVSRVACPRDVADMLAVCHAEEISSCLESQTPLILAPKADLAANGVTQQGEMVVLIPVLAFTKSIGVVLAVGDSRNRDLKDIELLRGIGNAIGLSIENLRQKEEIQAKEHRLRAVITAAPIVLMNTDANGVFTLLEGRGLDRLQIAPQTVVGRSVFEVFRGMPDVVGQFQRALAGEVVTVVAQIGDTTFEAELCPVGDGASNSGGGVIGVATDVTERKRAEEAVRHMAYHDSLTGLPNRELFENKLVESLAIAKERRSTLAIVFLDLDGFKHVNDTIGHAEGDRLLQEVAQQLTALIREGDTVARIGGDEFLVLLPEVTGAGEAEAVCDRILKGIRRDWAVGSHQFRISGSLGVAVFPADGADADVLIREADRAMYRAKDGGRDRYSLVATAG